MIGPAFEPAVCLIVEDDPFTSRWLAGIAASAFPCLSARCAGSLAEAQATLAALPPTALHVALVDLSLPDGSGVDFIAAVAARAPAAVAIVATTFNDDAHIFRSIAAGARGYILKSESAEMIEALLARILRGEPSLSPSVAMRVLDHFSRHIGRDPDALGSPHEPPAGLSPRETETLKLIAKGLTAAEVGRELGLKPHTIASYVKVIYQKLNISSRAEAAREAQRRGLV